MTRKTTTVMLENAGCGGGSTHTVEKALRDVPGVSRAYVNPATEAAYVEYDADRCSQADLESAVESVGVHALHPAATRRPGFAPSPIRSKRRAMHNTGSRSRIWWAFTGFIAIAGFFLITEHRAHLYGALPYILLIAFPLLHMFGHGGHGGHGGRGGHGDDAQRTDSEHAGQTDRAGTVKPSSGGHQHRSRATGDDLKSSP